MKHFPENSRHTACVNINDHPANQGNSKGKMVKALVNTPITKCAYNDQKHVRAQNNWFQPYPLLATIRARIGSKMV